jgi:hypothetical protein
VSRHLLLQGRGVGLPDALLGGCKGDQFALDPAIKGLLWALPLKCIDQLVFDKPLVHQPDGYFDGQTVNLSLIEHQVTYVSDFIILSVLHLLVNTLYREIPPWCNVSPKDWVTAHLDVSLKGLDLSVIGDVEWLVLHGGVKAQDGVGPMVLAVLCIVSGLNCFSVV